jgi:hypothetical protein
MKKMKKSEKFQVLSSSANNKILLALFADNGRAFTEREQYIVIQAKNNNKGYSIGDIQIGLNDQLQLSLLSTSFSNLKLNLSELKIIMQFLEQKSQLQK